MEIVTLEHDGKVYADFDREKLVELVGESVVYSAEREQKLVDVNRFAGAHIGDSYPIWKQLNITRNGSEQDKLAMNVFIDAVRAWANSNAPQQSELEAIKA